MAQDAGAGFGAIDPFGQFLMAAYLQGMVPGSQTSAYNTVLDLLSPGAVAGRQEAGVPNVAEQFENMFGGTMLTPPQVSQMQQQAAGLKTTPAEELAAKVEMDRATREYLVGLTQAGYERDVGMETAKTARDVGFEQARVEELKIPGMQAERDARIAQSNALANYYNRQGVTKPNDPRQQKEMFELNMMSLAMYNAPWDFQTGKPAEGVEVNPQAVAGAKALLGFRQKEPIGASTMNTLLNSTEPGMQALGQEMFKRATGLSYEDHGFWLWPWNWLESGVEVTGTVGGNQQALLDRIHQLEKWLPMTLNKEQDQAEIDRLKAELTAAGGTYTPLPEGR